MLTKQFRLWHLMFAVTIAALILGVLVWLFPHQRQSAVGEVIVSLDLAGYEIPQNSPVFWLITGSLVLAVLGIVTGLLTALLRVVRARR